MQHPTPSVTRRQAFTSLTLAALASLAAPAQAADFKAGEWDLSLGGIVNAYYTRTDCSGDQTVTGLALATQGLGCGGDRASTTVGNGLLPNALVVGAKTRQEGYDISATLMIGAAVSSSDAIGNNNNVDVRQGFVTFGNAEMGTLKFGRDYGLFGANAILSDMTLVGAGAPVNATQANRVTLGHIGAGYSYLGHYGQLAYTLPTMSGFSASLGVMSPVDSFANVYKAGDGPQLQLQASFTLPGGKLWASAKRQHFRGDATAPDFTMKGFELGGSATLGSLGVLANWQTGTGLGVLADGDNGDQKQNALLVQATWQATPKAKLGLSYGLTRLKDATGSALERNDNLTAGLYFALTKSLTLVGELSQTRSKADNGDQARMKGIALGGILFF